MTKNDKPVALEMQTVSDDDRVFSPSTARNRDPILHVLKRYLTSGMRVFEIASGTGEHGLHIVRNISGVTWQPSDRAPEALISIEAWRRHADLDELLPPLSIDVVTSPWPPEIFDSVDAVVCINMIHISPWEACQSVLRGAGRTLDSGGILVFYGPFCRQGQHTAPSNQSFDLQLRNTDPRWGIRDIDEVTTAAAAYGLALQEIVEMPANNLMLILRKTSE